MQANFADVTKPTLTITAPTAGQHMTNALATVIGTASDNWKVSAVWYQLTNGILTGGTWSLATTTNNYTNWTTTVTLAAGTNTVKAYAVDLGGNYSTTSSVSVFSSNTFKLQLNFAIEPAADQHRIELYFANFIQSERSRPGFDQPDKLGNADQFRRHQYHA